MNYKERYEKSIKNRYFLKYKKNLGCPKKYGNKKISDMSWMNVAKSYSDLFYTPKSLAIFSC